MNKIRGWKNIAEYYGRSKSTVRTWFVDDQGSPRKGCPNWMEGNVNCIDTDTFTPWLDEVKPNWRNYEASEEVTDVEVDKGDSQRLRELTMRQEVAIADKREYDAEKARLEVLKTKGNFSTKAEMQQAFNKGLVEVRNFVDEYVVKLKAEVPELSATRSEELDGVKIELFNKLASIRFAPEESAG